MAARSNDRLSLFKFLEIIAYAIARNEKNRIRKPIDAIPEHIMQEIKKCHAEDTIYSYDDAIEWLLDQVYINYNEDELLWFHLLFGNNDKLIEDLATDNKIPIETLHLVMLKRLLKNMTENFDAYSDFSQIVFERIDKIN